LHCCLWRVAAALQFTCAIPGIYQARFKITDSQGNVAEKLVPIVVQDPAQIDQLLKAQWGGMTSALIAGDKAHALTYLNAQGQEKYGPVFDKLMPQMTTIFSSASPPQSMSLSQRIGEYAVNRTIDGINRIFLIYFLQGDDGVWRIDSM